MTTLSKKSTNLTSVRFDDYTLAVIDKAASLLNQTRAAFLKSTARDKAEEVIRERTRVIKEMEALVLSSEASEEIAENLLNPPSPNAKLIQAMKQFNDNASIQDRS